MSSVMSDLSRTEGRYALVVDRLTRLSRAQRLQLVTAVCVNKPITHVFDGEVGPTYSDWTSQATSDDVQTMGSGS